RLASPAAGAIRCRGFTRGVAQLGSALRSGRRGRGFESRHPDSRVRETAPPLTCIEGQGGLASLLHHCALRSNQAAERQHSHRSASPVEQITDRVVVLGSPNVQLHCCGDVFVPHDLRELVRNDPVVGQPRPVRVPEIGTSALPVDSSRRAEQPQTPYQSFGPWYDLARSTTLPRICPRPRAPAQATPRVLARHTALHLDVSRGRHAHR
ncbi:MAG: hypothetical protein QOF66_2998, partial [Mycobacterium sp.]|nr:hypothetical protein [Mycobacterium sp.]